MRLALQPPRHAASTTNVTNQAFHIIVWSCGAEWPLLFTTRLPLTAVRARSSNGLREESRSVVLSTFSRRGRPCQVFGKCDGCDIVQADHAPEAGVAQGIFHGDLIRHQGRHQEELEEELKEEVENAQATKHRCACMDDME